MFVYSLTRSVRRLSSSHRISYGVGSICVDTSEDSVRQPNTYKASISFIDLRLRNRRGESAEQFWQWPRCRETSAEGTLTRRRSDRPMGLRVIVKHMLVLLKGVHGQARARQLNSWCVRREPMGPASNRPKLIWSGVSSNGLSVSTGVRAWPNLVDNGRMLALNVDDFCFFS